MMEKMETPDPEEVLDLQEDEAHREFPVCPDQKDTEDSADDPDQRETKENLESAWVNLKKSYLKKAIELYNSDDFLCSYISIERRKPLFW